jgi:3-deoxy-D-manno-octulosonate 8-phosphate phosphatase (KDO 8-P phosphatase)
LREPLGKITLIVLDVDGTMTDGGIYIDETGVESKKFNVKDGLGIKLAREAGIEFLMLTGRKSPCVEKRAAELGVKYLAQGIADKRAYLEEFAAVHKLSREHIAYIGDDLNDLPAMRCAGVAACPQDAAPQVREYCGIVLRQEGGKGAVREFIEKIIRRQIEQQENK